MQRPSERNDASRPGAEAGTDYFRFFNLSLDLLCVAGLDGYFKRVNPAWTRVLGWSEAEFLARPVVDFMHPEDRERTLRARAELARGIPLRGLENRYLCKDGTFRWLAWQSVAEPQASLVFAVARDVTERRQLDEERLVVGKLESTGVLAGGLAHDFNNLLASLLLNVEMMNLCGPLSDEQRQHLRQAQDTIQVAKTLTHQLITFAEGDVSARRNSRLGDILRRAFDLALQGADLRADCTVAADLWPAEVDELQFAQVFRGLILNAREATPPGGRVRVQAENVHLAQGSSGSLPAGDYVRITIRDEGTGIPPEVMPKIFDPYFSTKERGIQKGMGLGLTICRSVIQRHGGAIAVESRPGRGTTVVCHVPAVTVAVPPPATPAHLPARTTSRILVMDDEAVFREIIGRVLRQFGYEVSLAVDGAEALQHYDRAAAEGRPFSLVLLDLTVRGGLGGLPTIEALRARDPAVCAVLMTGYSNDETFRQHARHGFRAALAKPFTAESLRRALDEIFGAPVAAPPRLS